MKQKCPYLDAYKKGCKHRENNGKCRFITNPRKCPLLQTSSPYNNNRNIVVTEE